VGRMVMQQFAKL